MHCLNLLMYQYYSAPVTTLRCYHFAVVTNPTSTPQKIWNRLTASVLKEDQNKRKVKIERFLIRQYKIESKFSRKIIYFERQTLKKKKKKNTEGNERTYLFESRVESYQLESYNTTPNRQVRSFLSLFGLCKVCCLKKGFPVKKKKKKRSVLYFPIKKRSI